jgi:hypothetical protein
MLAPASPPTANHRARGRVRRDPTKPAAASFLPFPRHCPPSAASYSRPGLAATSAAKALSRP